MNIESLDSTKAKEILASRKAIIAKEKMDLVVELDKTILVFKIDNKQKYAIPYEQIERVVPFQKITPIPGISTLFLGAIYNNTEVWPVINCSQLFELNEAPISYFLLCQKGTQRLALSVKEIVGQVRYKETEELAHLANEKKSELAYIRGIYQTDIAIIEIKSIFDILGTKF